MPNLDMDRMFESMTEPTELTAEIDLIGKEGQGDFRVSEIHGGVLNFSETIFKGVPLDSVYAQEGHREAQGKGPHFDLSGDFLDEQYPILGVYNLSGFSILRLATMPDQLAKAYFDTYPELNEAAYEARRQFGAIVLNAPNIQSFEGNFTPGMALVIPQLKNHEGPHVVHEIIPTGHGNTFGKYVKLAVPDYESDTAVEMLKNDGFIPLDELVTSRLTGEDEANDSIVRPVVVPGVSVSDKNGGIIDAFTEGRLPADPTQPNSRTTRIPRPTGRARRSGLID